MDCEKEVKVVPPRVMVVTGIGVVRVLKPMSLRETEVNAGEEEGLAGEEGTGWDVVAMSSVDKSSGEWRGRGRWYRRYSRSEDMLHFG
jgi:ABC-type antimicrobial peptide transport system ATPase subunit